MLIEVERALSTRRNDRGTYCLGRESARSRGRAFIASKGRKGLLAGGGVRETEEPDVWDEPGA